MAVCLAVALPAALLAPPAAAQQSCPAALKALEEDLGGRTGPLSPEELRTLLSSGKILAEQGRDEACFALAGEIQAMLARTARDSGDASERAASQMVRTPLAGAEKLSAGGATEIAGFLGTPVMGLGGQILGTIEDAIVGDNRAYLIVGSDGLVAIEDTFRPVPLTHFYRLDEDTLALKLDKTRFQTAPTLREADVEAGPVSWGAIVTDWWADHADEPPAGSAKPPG